MGPASIFISHRAEYGAIAHGLKEVIETGAQGKIEVFISEDIARGKQWRQSIEEQLRKADTLFLIYGAPYEDWSWCFYEAGYFTAVEAKSRARRIYCVTRPDVAPPGPLSHLQMVTTKDQLVTELMALYRRRAISPMPPRCNLSRPSSRVACSARSGNSRDTRGSTLRRPMPLWKARRACQATPS